MVMNFTATLIGRDPTNGDRIEARFPVQVAVELRPDQWIPGQPVMLDVTMTGRVNQEALSVQEPPADS